MKKMYREVDRNETVIWFCIEFYSLYFVSIMFFFFISMKRHSNRLFAKWKDWRFCVVDLFTIHSGAKINSNHFHISSRSFFILFRSFVDFVPNRDRHCHKISLIIYLWLTSVIIKWKRFHSKRVQNSSNFEVYFSHLSNSLPLLVFHSSLNSKHQLIVTVCVFAVCKSFRSSCSRHSLSSSLQCN